MGGLFRWEGDGLFQCPGASEKVFVELKGVIVTLSRCTTLPICMASCYHCTREARDQTSFNSSICVIETRHSSSAV